jgi:Putative prokaryotic signal transducing protein
MTTEIQDPDKFVTAGKYTDAVDAQMAKGLLESSGIECFLQGENANSLLGAAFRARLLVHKQDEGTARQILNGEVNEQEEDGDY